MIHTTFGHYARRAQSRRAVRAILNAIASGHTVTLGTYGRATLLNSKHANIIRERGGHLEIRHGKNWLCYMSGSYAMRID